MERKSSQAFKIPFFPLYQAQIQPTSLQTPLLHPCCYIQSLWCSSKWHRGWLGSDTVVSLLFLTLFLCSFHDPPWAADSEVPVLPWRISHSPEFVIPLFSPLFPCLLLVQLSCPFLNVLSHRCHLISVAQQCPELGLLEMTGTTSVERRNKILLC